MWVVKCRLRDIICKIQITVRANLYDDAIDVFVVVQLFDLTFELALCNRVRQSHQAALGPNLGRFFDLCSDVHVWIGTISNLWTQCLGRFMHFYFSVVSSVQQGQCMWCSPKCYATFISVQWWLIWIFVISFRGSCFASITRQLKNNKWQVIQKHEKASRPRFKVGDQNQRLLLILYTCTMANTALKLGCSFLVSANFSATSLRT